MNRAYFATNAFRKVTHVIFDMDGLLLDTEQIYTQATNNVVQKYGKVYDWSIKIQLMGLIGTEMAKKIVELLDLPITWEEYYHLAQQQYEILMPGAELMPDTEGVYKRIISEIAKEHGKSYTTDVRMKLIGTPERESSRIAVTEMKLPLTIDQFLHEFKTRSNKLITSCSLLPGAEQLIKHLHQNKVPIAVATSSSEHSTEIKIARHRHIFSLFNHIVMGGSDPDVKHGKPSPDVFLVCASRFSDRPKPEQCLVFEDAPNGVVAARTAGMQCIMVPDPHVTEDLRKDATEVIESLDKVNLEQFGLPPLK